MCDVLRKSKKCAYTKEGKRYITQDNTTNKLARSGHTYRGTKSEITKRERERERERQRDRETERERQTDRQTETDRQTDRQDA